MNLSLKNNLIFAYNLLIIIKLSKDNWIFLYFFTQLNYEFMWKPYKQFVDLNQ